jgi:hypothetical protein
VLELACGEASRSGVRPSDTLQLVAGADAERAGLVLSHTRRGRREHDPPLVWGDVSTNTGQELWCGCRPAA